jgi:putative hydrolase of the HAD superfamily
MAAGATPAGLLLDYAGVMTVPLSVTIGVFCAREGVEPDVLREAVLSAYAPAAADADIHALERGTLAWEDFEPGFAAQIGVAAGGLAQRLFGGLPADPAMVALVKRVRGAGIPVGLLSNSWGGAEGYDRAGLDELFDAVVLSGETGMRKPEPEIFALAAARLGLDPGQIVFVDDFPVNVAAARAAGLQAFVHTDPAATAAAVDELLPSATAADRRDAC